MIAFISIIYGSFYFLVFGKGIVKKSARNVSIFVGIGVVLIATIVFMWWTFSPTTADGRTFQYVVQIVPNVAGPVIEVPIDRQFNLARHEDAFAAVQRCLAHPTRQEALCPSTG